MKSNVLCSRIICALILISLFCCGTVFPKLKTPASSIFIADIKIVNDSMVIGKPSKITTTTGYNDQPEFLSDGKSLLYTSIRTGSRTEVYRYDLKKKTTTKMTKSPASEYCPKLVPGGAFYSVLRFAKDSTRQLWRIPVIKAKPYVVLPDIKTISSYTWIDGVFGAAVVTEDAGNTLRSFNAIDNTSTVITGGVGMCIQKAPKKGGLGYIQKRSDSVWVVKVYDFTEKRNFEIVRTLPGSEDFAWTGWDDLVMGSGAKLYTCRPPKETEWKLLADFSKSGIKKITRIAIDPQTDKIAFVSMEK
jgi:hypothetical protein